MGIQIQVAPASFTAWAELLQLLHDAFAYQTPRINPPSSLHQLDVDSLAHKAREETVFLAFDEGELVGCAFARPKPHALYVGKVAVRPGRQGQGIGRQLMAAVEALARQRGDRSMELDTRIELVENHATFGALGFVRTAEHAHAGFDRPTYVTMQKPLA